MNDRNERDEMNVVDRATAALRDAPVPDGPSRYLVASTLEVLRVSDTVREIRPGGRKRLLRAVGYFSAVAASLLMVLAGSMWLVNRNASMSFAQVFAQVVENIKKANSVSFVVKQKFGAQPEFKTKMYIQGDLLRNEIADSMVFVVDTKAREGLQLDKVRKLAKKMDLKGRATAEQLQDIIQRLRNLKEDSKGNVEQLGDEELQNRICHVYRIKGYARGATAFLMGDEFTMWVDAKTGLPVKIHSAYDSTSLTYEQIKWDEPLKQELFSMKIPKGYLLEELTPAVIKPNRIYYHEGTKKFCSIEPDGKNLETQFVPDLVDEGRIYCSDEAELSPDGRYLAIAYPNNTDHGSFPPNRVLLWDRVRPKDAAVEIYLRANAELNSWQFSADGRLLYVNWWEHVAGQAATVGRTGTDVVDLKTKAAQPINLPNYKKTDGQEQQMSLAAVSADGQKYLVKGQGLHLATPDGKLVRRLTSADPLFTRRNARFSPDGKQAVYTVSHGGYGNELWVVSLEGGDPKQLVHAGKYADLRARWSPDGRKIAYTCRLFDPDDPWRSFGKEAYLNLIDADGSNPVTLVTKQVPGINLELTAWR